MIGKPAVEMPVVMTAANPSKTYSANGNYTAQLRVTDNTGTQWGGGIYHLGGKLTLRLPRGWRPGRA